MTQRDYDQIAASALRVLSAKDLRKLRMYEKIESVRDRIERECPWLPKRDITAAVMRHISESLEYAPFRQEFPDYPKSTSALLKILRQDTILQMRAKSLVESMVRIRNAAP